MDSLIEGTELRVFVPTLDVETSKDFYRRLGFTDLSTGEAAIFGAGAGSFLLRRVPRPLRPGGLIISLHVDDLAAWWKHIDSLDLPAHFRVPAPQAPEMKPWGREVAVVGDPFGTVWHFSQRPKG